MKTCVTLWLVQFIIPTELLIPGKKDVGEGGGNKLLLQLVSNYGELTV